MTKLGIGSVFTFMTPSLSLSLLLVILGIAGLMNPVGLRGEWRAGHYGGEFMEERGGARYLALGRSGVGLSDDVWAILWNPAALPSDGIARLGVMHSRRFEGVVNYEAVTALLPQPDGSPLGLSLIRSGVEGIPFTRLENPNAPLSPTNRVVVEKSVREGEYALSLARNINLIKSPPGVELRWGIAPKLIFKHIGNYRAYGLGIDGGGVLKRTRPIPFTVGFTIRDIGGSILGWEQTGAKEVITSLLRLGVSGYFSVPPLEAEIQPVIEGAFQTHLAGTKEAFSLHTGLEYRVKRVVSLRVGSDKGDLTLGAGLKIGKLSVDYALIDHPHLGVTHRLSLDTLWPSPKSLNE